MSQKMEKQFEQRLAALAELLKLPENKECADCGAKGPKWASWSIGVFLCINCAGVHRSLGTHISKVRSATLDKWTDEQIDNMRNMGNGRAKLIYEANVPAGYPRPREGAPSHTLESWIRAKYDKKQFMDRGRAVHKEKREEPSSYHQSTHHRQRSEPAPHRPSPPSPRGQHTRHQSQVPSTRQPEPQQKPQPPAAKPLLFLEEPTPVHQSAADPFGLLGGLQQQHHQQQQHQQQPPAQGSGHDTSFFTGGQQQQQQQKTMDKNSILSLYHQPIAPTMGGMMPHTAGQPHAPNYNVHLMPTNMYMSPTGVPMMMSPSGQLVPAMGYPTAQQGWPMQPGQPMMGMATPYGYPAGQGF
jgi:stromal membrane-associated protein